jgi:hypothetical protein
MNPAVPLSLSKAIKRPTRPNESSPSMSMQTQLTTYLFKSKCNFAFENAKKNKQKVYPMVDLV